MRTKLYYILFAAVLSFCSLQCTNPIDNINLQVDADVIRYSVVVEVKDVTGAAVPASTTVSISGAGANAVYDLSGSRKISLVDGMISLGLDPRMEPTAGKPVTFNVNLSGPNYLPVSVPVTISAENFAQIRSANLINTANPPAGVAIATATATVTGGAITQPLTVSTTAKAGAPEVTTVAIPANTQFKDAEGKVITSGTLAVSIVQFDQKQSTSLAAFPGGGYAAETFLNAKGEEGFGTFEPAGFSEISMNVGGTAVKGFSQPVKLSVVLDPTYLMSETGSPVKAGDIFNVSSYDNTKGKWQMESDGTVVLVNGKLMLDFTTTHLTWFSWGRAKWYPKPPVPPYTYLSVTAPALETTVPVRVELSYPKTNFKFQHFTGVLKPKDPTVYYAGILSGTETYNYTITSLTTNQVLAKGSFRGGATTNVSVTIPAPANPIISMTLTVKCPGKQVVVTPPDFFLYYKESNAASQEFKLLGLVVGGKFNTSELKVGTLYDFKAVWGSKTKIVYRKTVTVNNSMEVNEGNYGSHRGNLTLLIEECK